VNVYQPGGGRKDKPALHFFAAQWVFFSGLDYWAFFSGAARLGLGRYPVLRISGAGVIFGAPWSIYTIAL
jgi:hypothetical protein